MATYGFVIDQRRCIGCHACTIACKSENQVPIGVFRTWVKYVEEGRFPDARRHFLVQRCNHCANAPCTTICPTRALYRRRDGIVDFDGARCIGCKACMQACPYEALYIDPDAGTAAKCHYCAHRVDVGLKPACVVVCPTEAIVSGDLEDPASRIAQLLRSETVAVRRPDQGTQPRLWYVGAEPAALEPERFRDPEGGMWSQRRGAAPRAPVGAGRDQPIAEEGGQVDYNVAHERPWGGMVSAYLWTKSIAAGALLVLPLAVAAGAERDARTLWPLSAALALLFTLATTALLVADLRRPERFYYLLTKGNPASWLVRGAYVLMAYGGVAAAGVAAVLLGWPWLLDWLLWPGAALGALAAAYSAFLFGQAEGRDFWQSPLLAPHLVAQASLAGAAALLLVAPLAGASAATVGLLAWTLGVSLLVHAGFAVAEVTRGHRTRHGRLAAKTLREGRLALPFRGLALAFGVAAPAVLVAGTLAGLLPVAVGPPAASVLALAGLLAYEHLWLLAGQSVPMS